MAICPGMFKPEYINITDFARIGQKNALAIKVYPVDMPGTIKPKQWGAAGGISQWWER
ncbi:MAG: hypothetical protein ACLUIE_10685 [Parabacteroides merdae]